jgi:hypothetical protein
MPKFRKKPVVIDAEQFTAPENHEGAMFMLWPVQKDEKGYHLKIETLEGDMRANEGDWIIKGVSQEFYPCKNDIFEATYERVE